MSVHGGAVAVASPYRRVDHPGGSCLTHVFLLLCDPEPHDAVRRDGEPPAQVDDVAGEQVLGRRGQTRERRGVHVLRVVGHVGDDQDQGARPRPLIGDQVRVVGVERDEGVPRELGRAAADLDQVPQAREDPAGVRGRVGALRVLGVAGYRGRFTQRLSSP